MRAEFDKTCRITVTVQSDEGYRQITDIFELDRSAHDRASWLAWYHEARERTRLSENPDRLIEVSDPDKWYEFLTDRQNRIADARVCLEQIRIHKARLRAALSGNYEGVE